MIENWNELTQEQKDIAIEQLKTAGLESSIPKDPHPASIFFNQFNWVKIDNFISAETAQILYHHVKQSAQRLAFMEETFGKDGYDPSWFGVFGDGQVDNDYARYGDPIFDALLDCSTAKISELVNRELVPNYTYYRLYTTGAELKPHIDRESCDYSVTLCLGYDVSNVDTSVYADYDWPMYVETDLDGTGAKGFPGHMKPGDMLIYRGQDVKHWREPFIGKNHAQVFMHYNDKSNQLAPIYDGRPMLGLPDSFKS